MDNAKLLLMAVINFFSRKKVIWTVVLCTIFGFMDTYIAEWLHLSNSERTILCCSTGFFAGWIVGTYVDKKSPEI